MNKHIESLNSLIYTKLYNKYVINIDTKTKFDELLLFFEYSIINNNYLMIYLVNDILRNLNKLKNLNYFFNFYYYSIKIIKKEILNKYILNSINNSYFKNPLFGKIFLKDYETQINFQKNFKNYTFNLFDNFKWSNCIIAGGSIFKIIQHDYEKNISNFKYSDIDIFLYGQTKSKKKKIIYILNYLIYKLKEIYVVNYKNVLSIISPNYKREIQIIIGYYKTPLQIINDFDLTHLQISYNGTKIQTTDYCLESIHKKQTKLTKFKINENLLYKIFSTNYDFIIDPSLKKEYLTILSNYKDINSFVKSINENKKKKHKIIENLENFKDKISKIASFKNIDNNNLSRIINFNCSLNENDKNLDKIYLNFEGSFDYLNFYLSKII